MRCFKCGLAKSGEYDPSYQCDDCRNFSPIVTTIWKDVDSDFNKQDIIDPDAKGILKLLADTTFVTATNPQTRIFYQACEILVASALQGEKEITDSELAKRIRTTRGFTEIFRVLTELKLVTIRNEAYHRVLVYQPKLLKMAQQYLLGTKVSEQLTKRLAHVYAGYILLYVMSIVAEMQNEDEVNQIPYSRRPKTLWVVLMFLWKEAYDNHMEFTFEQMRIFFAKRGLTISVVDTISRRLQALDGKTTQGLIKEFKIEDTGLRFAFEDYVIAELGRIREMERTR